MADPLFPTTPEAVQEVVRAALSQAAPLDVLSSGSKRGFGRPAQAERAVSLARLSGFIKYEPEELVLTALPGTPLAEIESALADRHQELAFEPPDYGPLLAGEAPDADAPTGGTLGGALACNLAGPRRIKAGGARDHFLGVAGISGRGEAFKSGGRVVKNVTGYDMCKLLAGSHGTLALFTEVTVKVLPVAEKTRTVLLYGLDDAAAVAAMGRALQGPFEVSGAAHLPAPLAARSAVDYVAGAGAAVTALRLEGVGPSVEARCDGLRQALAEAGRLEELHSHNSRRFWREVRDALPLVDGDAARVIWRLSVPPAAGAAVVAALAARHELRAFYDCGGGLVWLSLPASADAEHTAVRAAIAACGGHATLLRAPAAVRAAVPVFQPQPPALAQLTARVKDSFDPQRILNPGRMYAGV